MCYCHVKGYKRYAKQGVKNLLSVSPLSLKNKTKKK